MDEKATAERIRQAFWYNKKTGELIWLIQAGSRSVPGQRAGSIHTDQDGYQSRHITLDKKIYIASHVIWVWMTGGWPTRTIDHKNTDSLDDSWENLREAGASQQKRNSKRYKNNTTGTKCVYWDKDRECWTVRVTIRVDGERKRLRLGRYETKEEAELAYHAKINELHGEFANAGT